MSYFKQATSLVLEELRKRSKKPLFLAVAGSHVYGLEREDSDIDIRGIYLEPSINFLKLSYPKDTVEGFITPDSSFNLPRIDYQCYELKKFLNMLLASNGNMVRLLLSPLQQYVASVHETDELIFWEKIGKAFLTKRLASYYKGYAAGQRKRAMTERGGKALIYTYREIFEGLVVMRVGYPIFNFVDSWKFVRDRGYYKHGLLDLYYKNYAREVTDEGWHQFYAEWEELCKVLDRVKEESTLPEAPDQNLSYALENFLIRLRLRDMDKDAYTINNYWGVEMYV